MNRGNPRIEQPNDDPALHPNRAPSRSLVDDLGEVADDLRQLYTDFGLRPYRVFSVIYRWTGGSVGHGEALVFQTEELLPTPEVRVASIRSELKSAGLVERGDSTLVGVSPRYTEDQIRTLFHCSENGELPPDLQGFVEVVMDARDGVSERRRFSVAGVPQRRADRFDWEVRLIKQDDNRRRNGQPARPAR